MSRYPYIVKYCPSLENGSMTVSEQPATASTKIDTTANQWAGLREPAFLLNTFFLISILVVNDVLLVDTQHVCHKMNSRAQISVHFDL